MIINPNEQQFKTLNSTQVKAINLLLSDKRIKFENVENCILCGSSEFDVIALVDQYKLPCETSVCKCGLIFTSCRYDNKSTSIFYQEYYRRIYEGIPGPSNEHLYYQKLYSGWVPRVPRFVKKNWLIVEFGCGGGWNLSPYKRQDIAYEGWDYDSAMVEYGRRHYGLNLFEGGIEDFLETRKRADYVILSQVLEHVDNPIAYLERVRKCLRIGGLVAIYVPSINFAKYFGGNSTHWDLQKNLQNAHNFLFSENTLEAVLLRAGLTPLLVAGGYALAKNDSDIKGKSIKVRCEKDMFQQLLKMQQRVHVKDIAYSLFPKLVRGIILDKMYYYLNPLKTLRRISLEKFGII